VGELNPLELLLVSLAISLDTFAASLAIGAQGEERRGWRIAAAFGAVGALLLVLGLWVGGAVSTTVRELAEWLGALVLAALGLWTLRSSMRESPDDALEPATSGGGLLLLSAGLSIDNLVVGFGLGLHGTEPWLIGPVAGGVILATTLAGLAAGRAGYTWLGSWATRGAGVLLLLLAAALVLGWI
jgi:manganese efflux pump family protein